LKTQAAAGAIDLVFLDETAALTHPYPARCWARRGANPRIEAPGQSKKRAMLGAFDPVLKLPRFGGHRRCFCARYPYGQNSSPRMRRSSRAR
jgi:hypothetical protein